MSFVFLFFFPLFLAQKRTEVLESVEQYQPPKEQCDAIADV